MKIRPSEANLLDLPRFKSNLVYFRNSTSNLLHLGDIRGYAYLNDGITLSGTLAGPTKRPIAYSIGSIDNFRKDLRNRFYVADQ